MLTELLIVGAGGHAKVIIDTVQAAHPDCRIVLADQDQRKVGKYLLSQIRIIELAKLDGLPNLAHIAVGDNGFRKKLTDTMIRQGKALLTILHPGASISPYASLDEGGFVAAQAVIGPDAIIASSVIVNHGAVVDHDCRVGAYSHIAPNATLGGGVIVGEKTLIGAGATILPMVCIGSNVTVAAGAVILSDVPDNQTVMGVPGKRVVAND